MERQRLRHLATEAMAASLLRSTSARRRDRPAATARPLLLLDPHHEGACRALMPIHAYRGEHTPDPSIYEPQPRRLTSDLGLTPEPATLAPYLASPRRRATSPSARTATHSGGGEDR